MERRDLVAAKRDSTGSEVYCFGTLHGELLWNDMAEVVGAKLKPL